MIDVKEIRCSGLSRPMTCSGSLFFENLPKQPTNAAAEEGTAAGEWLQFLLENKNVPVPTHAKNGVYFDDEMKFFTEPIAAEIFKRAKTKPLCETRIDWPTRSGIWIRGSYDISYVDNDDNLVIEDLKYGYGLVEVKENWQLLGYAIGEVIRRQTAFDKIILRIQQPRPHHEEGPTREWVMTYNELLVYKEMIETKMIAIAGGGVELVTSSKCKYCPAAPEACTAFNRAAYAGIDFVLNHFQQDHLSEREIQFQLDLMGRVMDVLKIKDSSLKELAVARIAEGKIIPSYMTEASYGDRKWKKGVSPKAIEVMTGRKIVEETMLSPAKAEKLGIPKEVINSLVDRHFVGQKLVRKDANAIGDKIFNNKGAN